MRVLALVVVKMPWQTTAHISKYDEGEQNLKKIILLIHWISHTRSLCTTQFTKNETKPTIHIDSNGIQDIKLLALAELKIRNL